MGDGLEVADFVDEVGGEEDDGFLGTVGGDFLYTWGLQRMESGKAAIFVAVEPVVGAVVGMTFYNEPYNFVKILGMILIVGSIILLGFSDSIKIKKGR